MIDRRGRLVLVVSFASLALALVACGVTAFSVATGGTDPLPVQSHPEVASAGQVEAVAQVTLPPGTVLLGAAYSNGLETQLSARFRIPRASRDAFLRDGAFTSDLTPGLRAVDASNNVGGGTLWHPEKAESVEGLRESNPTPDGTYRAVMFDLGAPDTITVYLYAWRD